MPLRSMIIVPVRILTGVSFMKNVLLSAVFVGFSAIAAFAASHAGEMDFTVVDADANGMVTMEEATAAGWKWSEEDFTAADTDADGSLNAEEFAAAAAM